MRKIKEIRLDHDVIIPGDGSTSYLVLVKKGDNTWYSCGELIDDEADALLYAASDDLLEVAKLVVNSQGWNGNDPDLDKWGDLYRKARLAVAKATGGGK